MAKQIKGVVKSYSKITTGDKNSKSFAYVDMQLLDQKYSYRFFFNNESTLKEKLIERVPIGSTVEFEIDKQGDFWSVNQKSFEVLYEGNGTTPESQKPSSQVSDTNTYIVRQNALAHADAKRHNTNMPDDEYFKFAEECEKWILR